MSYWRFPLLLMVLLALAAGLAACGDGGGDDPQQVLDSAGLEGVSSGRFDASLAVESKGERAGNLEVSISGQFQEGRKDQPRLDVNAEVKGSVQGKKIDFSGGLTFLSDYGFVDYQGTDYEIETSNFVFAESIFLPILGESEKPGKGIEACRRAGAGLRLSDLVESPRDAGTVDVDGTETTKIVGELDFSAVTGVLKQLAGDPECRKQIEALSPLSLPELRQAGDDLAAAVKRAPVTVYVDGDHIVRKLEAELSAKPKSAGGEEIVVDLELSLSEVNEPQKIEVPATAKPLGVLFAKLGIDQLEFFFLGNGGEVVAYLLEKIGADALP